MGTRYGKKSRVYAAFAVGLILSLTMPLMRAYAYGSIDTEKTCTLTVSVEHQAGGEESYAEDLKTASIPVKLYRVADISKAAKYTPIAGLEGMDVEKIGRDENITAGKLLEMAGEIAVKLGIADEDGKPADDRREADIEFEASNGSGTKSGIPTGLYLVWIEPVKTAQYSYTFSPYLISLPNNTYFVDGNDDWDYGETAPVTIGLKAERENLFGKLEIRKTLDTYNASLGEAAFVFQVEAVKNIDGEMVKVYSNMITLNFAAPGTKSAVVDQIPAESEVTVKEIYSGSSYELTQGADGYTIRLAAAGEDDEAQSVSFTNDYNGGNNQGSGIVNHYEYDGNGFSGKQMKDNQKQDSQD